MFEIFEKNPYLCICRSDFSEILRENPKTRSPHPV